MLTPEEIKELKSQLSEQIENLPPEKKAEAQKQIDDLSPTALESMIKQQQSRNPKNNKGIFRMIADKDIPSRIIDETPLAIAVLDIKPISKGHIIIVPKKAISDSKLIPSSLFTLAKKISRILSTKLKPTGTEIQTEFKFGEIILNVIPIYDKPVNLNSPRLDLTEKDLDSIHQILRVIKKPKMIRIKKPLNTEKTIQLKRRIP